MPASAISPVVLAEPAEETSHLAASQERQRQLQTLLATEQRTVSEDTGHKRQILQLLLQAEDELQAGTAYDLDTVLSELQSR